MNLRRVESSDAVSVTVHDFGGRGPSLLISHATGFNAHAYVPMAETLAGRFHSFGLDFRGHGDTPAPPGWEVDWRSYGDDAHAAAQAVAPGGRLIGFGHSMGGSALLMAAHRDPSLFALIVAFEPIGSMPNLSSSPPTPNLSSSPPTPNLSSSPPTPNLSSSPPTPNLSSSPPTPDLSSSPPTPNLSSSPPTPNLSSSPPTPDLSSSPPTPDLSNTGPQVMLTTMVEAARRRRRSFGSYQDAIDNYGSKPPMDAFDPEALRNYVEHGFAPSADGVTLRCDPELEAQTFLNGRNNGVWELLPEITTPVVLVIGEEEEIGPASIGEAMAQRLTNGAFRSLAHLDHMAPFTHPSEMAEIVADAADRVASR